MDNEFFYLGIAMKSFERDVLKDAIRGTVKRLYEAQVSNLNIYRNTLDCFSASLDALVQGISVDEWLTQEKERQIQKTKQNAIGTLHEDILGSIDGVLSLPVGNLIDIIFENKKIIAEVKNKHNTTKGNHKVQIYRDLAKAIDQSYRGYTGYYVEILPKGAKSYDETFTPSDNQTGSRLEQREDIRRIDGRSFYALLTGKDNAIDELYDNLPQIVSEIIMEEFSVNLDSEKITKSKLFYEIFAKAYGERS